MRRILDLAWLNVLQIRHDRGEMISLLVLPVLLTLIFGMAFGGKAKTELVIAVTDEDRSAYSQRFVKLLDADESSVLRRMSASEARTLVDSGKLDAAVTVGRGFGEGVEKGAGAKVEVLKLASQQGTAVGQIVQGAADRVAAGTMTARIASEALAESTAERDRFRRDVLRTPTGPTFSELYEKADAQWEPTPPVTVRTERLTASKVRGDMTQPDGYGQYSIGFTVMFVLFIAVGGAGGILEDRELGTLRRLLVSPVSKAQLVGGKITGILMTTVLEAAILIGLGIVAFKVPWGSDPVPLLMVLAAYVLAATGLGMMLSAIVRTRSQLASLGNVLVVALAMLGGCYWPLEVVSPTMRTIAYATPTGWAMSGLMDVVARSQGVAAALTPTLVLLGFALAFFAVGIRSLKFE